MLIFYIIVTYYIVLTLVNSAEFCIIVKALIIKQLIFERSEYMTGNSIKNSPDSVVLNFMQVDRLHHACCDAAISSMGSGLHRTQHGMLMLLSHCKGDLNQKDIAEHFNISAAAVANTLKSLEQDGYIERKADKVDNRKNIVNITEKGNKVLSETKDAFDNIDTVMLSGISEDDLLTFRKCLDTMAENLKNEISGKDGK